MNTIVGHKHPCKQPHAGTGVLVYKQGHWCPA